jgi:NAD(P)-dependent dehydrogenase (short-subunit alcohol dehydrogenase family)
MDLGYKGKRCLVTASTGGLGFAIARCMAAEGATVVVNGRTEENTAKAAEQIASEVPGATIETVVDIVLSGIALVLVILFLFLGHFRTAVIVALTVPMALLFTFTVMVLFGESAAVGSVVASVGEPGQVEGRDRHPLWSRENLTVAAVDQHDGPIGQDRHVRVVRRAGVDHLLVPVGVAVVVAHADGQRLAAGGVRPAVRVVRARLPRVRGS